MLVCNIYYLVICLRYLINDDEYDDSVLHHIQYGDGDQDYMNETECRDEMDLYIKIYSLSVLLSENELDGDEYRYCMLRNLPVSITV